MEEIDRWNSQEGRFRRGNFFNREEKPSDGDENLSQREQNSSSDINLPQEFKFLPHQESFSKVFENISKWYGNNFSSEEKKIITNIRDKSLRGFETNLDEKKILDISNEIDGELFCSRNNDLRNIERNVIRGIKDPHRERQFREIAIIVKKRLGIQTLSNKQQNILMKEFVSAKAGYTVPNIDYLVQLLDKAVSDYSNPYQYGIFSNRYPRPIRNENNQDREYFETILGNKWFFDKNLVIYYCVQAKGMLNMLDDYYNKSSIRGEIDGIIIDVSRTCAMKGPMNEDLLQNTLMDSMSKLDPFFFNHYFGKAGELADDIILPPDLDEDDYNLDNDFEWVADDVYLEQEFQLDPTKAREMRLKHAFIAKKLTNDVELTPEEEAFYRESCFLFGVDGRGGYVRKLRKLQELCDLQARQAQEFTPKTVSSIEYTAGNIKNIRPDAIVENNEGIRNYIYGDNASENDNNVDDISFSNLSNEDKRRFFQQLIGENGSDDVFMDSIKYLDEYGNIDRQKAIADGIDKESLEINRAKIEHMILELAREEALYNGERSRINEIYIKKSSMLCCFRAISKFFDTVNNNGENFASEFKIDDLNNDIHFDEETGMITMEGTIGANQNHIKLYYNTKTGTLEFDNFLAYNSQDDCYKIGKGNGEREKINIVLPTMDEMQHQAKSINFDLINNFTSNAQIISRFVSKAQMYEHMVGLAMRESIWTNCFKGFMGADMEVNKYFVQQFNEKNILKQDIINSIYSKFYKRNDMEEKLDGCLVISAGNEPEQFKLIKLISDTIDNCGSCSALLRFRNAVNGLDDILTNNHDLVEKDDLLRYLFADNLSNREDLTDISRNIIGKENEDIAVSRDNQGLATYASNEEYDNKGNRTLNYYTFLDLLSENKSSEKLINIDTFETALSTITTSGKYLLSDEQGLLWKNYAKKRDEGILPDFKKQKELARIEKEMDKAYDNPN